MQVIRGVLRDPAAPPAPRLSAGSVLTIGNFDGVHRGHQALITHLRAKADALGLPATVLTFEPHPREFFAPHAAPARLTSLREKLELLREQGVDRVVVAPFCRRLAALSAEDFVHQVIAERLQTRHLVIGDDFHFGQARRGDFALLQEMGDACGFPVEAMPTLIHQDERVSSSAVRNCLQAGDLLHAERLLGRPYTIAGRVIHGLKLGRTLGFPTLNIQLKQRHLPLMGVFTVSVDGIADHPWPAVASLGIRPTIDCERKPTLEVHLFDFQGDLYGRNVQVRFLRKQRDEAKYDSLDALVAQIRRDADEARAWFAAHPTPCGH